MELDHDLISYASGSIKRHSSADREQYYVSLLNGSIAGGMIIVTPSASSFSTAALVVAIDPNTHCPGCLAFIAGNHAGAVEAMEYLSESGHRRIGFITGGPDLQSAQQRQQGYVDALLQAGIALNPALTTVDQFIGQMGYAAAEKLIELIRGKPLGGGLQKLPTRLVVRASCTTIDGMA